VFYSLEDIALIFIAFINAANVRKRAF